MPLYFYFARRSKHRRYSVTVLCCFVEHCKAAAVLNQGSAKISYAIGSLQKAVNVFRSERWKVTSGDSSSLQRFPYKCIVSLGNCSVLPFSVTTEGVRSLGAVLTSPRLDSQISLIFFCQNWALVIRVIRAVDHIPHRPGGLFQATLR